MRALEFITGYVIFKLHYDQIYQMKITMDRIGKLLHFSKNISLILNKHMIVPRV